MDRLCAFSISLSYTADVCIRKMRAMPSCVSTYACGAGNRLKTFGESTENDRTRSIDDAYKQSQNQSKNRMNTKCDKHSLSSNQPRRGVISMSNKPNVDRSISAKRKTQTLIHPGLASGPSETDTAQRRQHNVSAPLQSLFLAPALFESHQFALPNGA